MTSFKSLAGAAAFALVFGGAAHATVYHLVGQDIPPATATGTITTDGTIGVLSLGNITATDITVADPGGSALLNGLLELSGDGLTATSSGIYFDFSATDGDDLVLFDSSDDAAYCVATNDLTCGNVPHNEVILVGGDRFYQSPVLSGEVEIAAAAVPELSTWALMLAGFGLAGASMRARRSVAA
jgi:hypothetical protein